MCWTYVRDCADTPTRDPGVTILYRFHPKSHPSELPVTAERRDDVFHSTIGEATLRKRLRDAGKRRHFVRDDVISDAHEDEMASFHTK